MGWIIRLGFDLELVSCLDFGVDALPTAIDLFGFNDGSIWFLDNNRRIWLGINWVNGLGSPSFPMELTQICLIRNSLSNRAVA
ncbi:MAG: hypothetical protein IPJ71_19735 [Bdellovibrionales bacterium]|nr:hypothetical protein [Bdellovibrionales bacterium]